MAPIAFTDRGGGDVLNDGVDGDVECDAFVLVPQNI